MNQNSRSQPANNVLTGDNNSDRGVGDNGRLDSFSQDNYQEYQETDGVYLDNQNGNNPPWGSSVVGDSNVGKVSAEFVGDWTEQETGL